MMNQEVKRRIDNARQVLVGKVPDPKSQVEQITTALIYKFMDDMDKESERLGGKPGFFVNGYEKYSWTKLMDSRVGGQNRLNLYAEAIDKLSQNPHLPQLFRDIFKGAFLPYRDPETLNLFLKEIDGFSYSSTDNLGDAYEYLLSVLGSQGDAGQFRTPRHIINFIVSIVDPKKNETILDPACGTAGFLILAYLHILNASAEKKPGDMLSPDEKEKLIHNFVGYDIDPAMVRLSLVNMYLHHFPAPHIYEYDTLTYEEKWQEQFDVIMANPPFMSPKGGIRPHKRFAIQAKRSEILFVDYIAEHLNINGRAGVIVPEGIIFRSANAYKSLRKMLVNDYLWAVASFPAGVFQPYSGVKTSILFMDKKLARQADKILFVKVENDGFDLGAQRREIDKDDLPLATDVMNFYKNNIRGNKNLELPEGYLKIANIVPKQKIIDSGDYNLSAGRYKEVVNFANQKWPMVRLGEVCEIYNGSTPKRTENSYWDKGTIPWFTIDDIREQGRVIKYTKQKITKNGFENSSVKLLPINTVLLCCTASVGEYAYTEIELTTNQQFNGLVVNNNYQGELDPKFLFYLSSTFKGELERLSGKTSFNFVSVGILKSIKIPLPPLEVQKEIVEQIEVKQKAIEAAKAVVENLNRERRYFGQSLRKIEGVEMVKLNEVCEINRKTAEPIVLFGNSDFIYIDISSVENGTGILNYENKILSNEAPSRARRVIQNGDVLLSTVRPNLKAFAYLENLPSKALASTGFAVLTAKENVLSKYVFHLLFTDDLQNQMIGRMGKGSYPSINQDDVEQLKILLPSLEIQKRLVAEMEEQEKIIEANKKLVGIMEQKIAEVLREI